MVQFPQNFHSVSSLFDAECVNLADFSVADVLLQMAIDNPASAIVRLHTMRVSRTGMGELNIKLFPTPSVIFSKQCLK